VPNVNRRLAGFAVTVVVGHHVGVIFRPLGAVGPTYWADWIDLAVPYAVVGLAAAVLVAARAERRAWVVFGLGGIVYVQGHGIHLAANSIGHFDVGDTEHLWDEVVGHYLWYGGLTVVVAALAVALQRRPLPRSRWGGILAVSFGFTVFTNSVEGGTPVLGLAAAVAFIAWGARRRERMGWLLVPAYGVALVALVGWGLYWRGFPQFSELGWL
jgi:uncharacterized membrane protein YagU involved in acid resistance